MSGWHGQVVAILGVGPLLPRWENGAVAWF
jgi:hypothetical protein